MFKQAGVHEASAELVLWSSEPMLHRTALSHIKGIYDEIKKYKIIKINKKLNTQF